MKKILLVGMMALASAVFIPTDLDAQLTNHNLLAQNRNVVFRTTQKLRCGKTGEDIWFFRDGTWKLYSRNTLKYSGTYRASNSYITLYLSDGDELGYGTISMRNGNITRFTFDGDNYYPM